MNIFISDHMCIGMRWSSLNWKQGCDVCICVRTYVSIVQIFNIHSNRYIYIFPHVYYMMLLSLFLYSTLCLLPHPNAMEIESNYSHYVHLSAHAYVHTLTHTHTLMGTHTEARSLNTTAHSSILIYVSIEYILHIHATNHIQTHTYTHRHVQWSIWLSHFWIFLRSVCP